MVAKAKKINIHKKTFSKRNSFVTSLCGRGHYVRKCNSQFSFILLENKGFIQKKINNQVLY